jgi:hypothetical protein
MIANNRRFVIGKHPRHAGQISRAVQGDAEQAADRVLIFGDAVEITHEGFLQGERG